MPKDPIIQSTPIAANLERERLTSLINSMADGVIAIDKKLKVIVYNGSALNILDTNTLEPNIYLSKVIKLIDKKDKQEDLEKLINNIKTAWSSRDYRLTYDDKSKINLYISIAPVHLGYGKNADQGYVVVLRDISHEKSLEEERDEFISVISHELRTPVAIAEGNLSNASFIAEKRKDIPEITQTIKQAYDQVTFLSGMINDLSMLSRAERGKLTVQKSDVNIIELVKQLSENYRSQAENKGLKLHTHVDKTLELVYTSDLYVREILQNFITNAIKYTQEGSVTITAKAQNNGVILEISDTGIGINKGDKEHVFEKFFRSEDFRTRKTNGTGLGLYVTAKIARLINATITLESELNKGSTFRIVLPNLPRL